MGAHEICSRKYKKLILKSFKISKIFALLTNHVLESLGHHESTRPVEGRGHRGRRATDFGRQNLAHHQPGNGSKAEGEAQDVDDEAAQGQPAQVADLGAMRLAVEEAAQHKQRDDHGYAGHIQEDL